MEQKNDIATITSLCDRYGVPVADLMELLKALGAIPPREAERVLWMATGAAFAVNTGTTSADKSA